MLERFKKRREKGKRREEKELDKEWRQREEEQWRGGAFPEEQRRQEAIREEQARLNEEFRGLSQAARRERESTPRFGRPSLRGIRKLERVGEHNYRKRSSFNFS